MTRQIGLLAMILIGMTAVETLAQESCKSNSATGLVQGWTDGQRWEFYHKDQGAPLIPLAWYQALELTNTGRMFRDIVEAFNVVPDCPGIHNPDGLPVGLTTLEVDESPLTLAPIKVKQKWVGFTCAFCHTGQIKYYDKNNQLQSIRIDGGSSMQNNFGFGAAMVASVGIMLGYPPYSPPRVTADTLVYDERGMSSPLPAIQSVAWVPMNQCVNNTVKTDQFKRFVERLRISPADEKALRKDLCEFYMVKKFTAGLAKIKGIDLIPTYWPKGWGYGQLDAFGRAGNIILTNPTIFDRPTALANLQSLDAPVTIPHIWGAWDYERMQWTGSISNALARSAAETIGVGAPLKYSPKNTTPFLYPTINPEALLNLEDFGRTLKTPEWPTMFPAIDRDKSEKGKSLYADKCAGCHFYRDLSRAGSVKHIPIDQIGTDQTAAESLAKRVANTGLLKPMLNNRATVPAVDVMRYITTEMLTAFAQNTQVSGRRTIFAQKNDWDAKRTYMARPNHGIWSTPPYLHNGSIPNLYLLLSPQEVRDKQAATFCAGTLVFDPVYVGFMTAPCANTGTPLGELPFNTKLPGNSNRGHEFRNTPNCAILEQNQTGDKGVIGCELEEHQRWEIIEYMKTAMEPLTLKDVLGPVDIGR